MKIKNYSHIPIITIDGPTGTGKGTLCRILAQRMNWHSLDSGLIYRILANLVAKNSVDFNNYKKIISLISEIDLKKALNTNVFNEIRTEQCGKIASILAAIPEIRDHLLQKQRDYAILPGLVTDGREMGTVVFPNAFLKIWDKYLYSALSEKVKDLKNSSVTFKPQNVRIWIKFEILAHWILRYFMYLKNKIN